MASNHRTIRLLKEGVLERSGRKHRRNVAQCRFCPRTVLWCKTEAEKNIPFEENPDPIAVDDRCETVSTEHVHFGKCPGYQRAARA